MLKAMLPLSTVLGLFAAVPMSDDRQPRTLGEALYDTIETLEVLRGYRGTDPTSVDRAFVQEVTEPPLGDPQLRVERLETLADQLGGLHTHLQLLQAGAVPASAPIATPTTRPVRTLGLTEGELDRLVANSRRSRISAISPSIDEGSNGVDDARPAGPSPSNGRTPLPTTGTDTESTPSPDDAAAEADAAAAQARADASAAELAFAKARAAYFAGRYDRALVEFEALAVDPNTTYWRARCLEQLDRLDEALALYDQVVADPEAGDLARRAQGDADFLRWKVDFGNGASDQ